MNLYTVSYGHEWTEEVSAGTAGEAISVAVNMRVGQALSRFLEKEALRNNETIGLIVIRFDVKLIEG